MDYTPTILESRLDWVTLTSSKPERRQAFWFYALQLATLAAGKDGQLKRWRWKGYDGQHTQGVTVGRRSDSDILQLSGLLADEHFDLAWQHADNCTRLDLAVTVQVGEGVGDVIGCHHNEVLDWKREKARVLTVNLISSEGAPATLYLGRRISDLYARIYDKHLESNQQDYVGCIRYEVEVKGAPAERAASWLGSVGDRSSRIRDAVFKHCVQRGITPRFSSMGGAVHLKTIRPVSDNLTRLSWLATSVRPVVESLVIAGMEKQAVTALGLGQSATELARLRAKLELPSHRDTLWDVDEDE